MVKYGLIGVLALVLILLLAVVTYASSAEKGFTSINAGEKQIMLIDRVKIPVSSLSFILNKDLKHVRIEVQGFEEKLSQIPSVAGSGEKVYSFFNFRKRGVSNADISFAYIEFRVDKAWLDKNSVDPRSVGLMHYDGRWVKRGSKLKGDDEEYFYYEAYVPSLDLFALVGKLDSKKIAPPPVGEVKEIEEVVVEESKEGEGTSRSSEGGEGEVVEGIEEELEEITGAAVEEKKSSYAWIYAIVIIAVIIVLLLLGMRREKDKGAGAETIDGEDKSTGCEEIGKGDTEAPPVVIEDPATEDDYKKNEEQLKKELNL